MNLQRILPGSFWFTLAFKSPLYPCVVLGKILWLIISIQFWPNQNFNWALHLLLPRVTCLYANCQLQFLLSEEIGSLVLQIKKWFSLASFLLLIAWNSETHWLTSFDASLIHLDRRWTCSADFDSCSLISDASWSISLSQAVAPSLCLLALVIFSSVWKTRFKFVSIYYFDPSTCHLSANMNAVQHDK